MSTGHITQLSPMRVYLNVAAPKIKNAITLRSILGLLGLCTTATAAAFGYYLTGLELLHSVRFSQKQALGIC